VRCSVGQSTGSTRTEFGDIGDTGDLGGA